MAQSSSDSNRPSESDPATRRAPIAINNTHRLLWISLFTLLALALNNYPVEISFAVALIFGSVISLVVANICKPLSAAVVAAIASIPTYYHWGHLWSVGIFAAEALFVGVLVQRRPSGVFSSLVIKDALFWLLLGSPATLIVCWKLIGMPLDASLLVGLKQALNGVFNAVVAEFCLYLLIPRLRRQRWFEALPVTPAWPIRDLVLAFMVGTVLSTGLIMTTQDSRLISRAEQQRLSDKLAHESAMIKQHLSSVTEDTRDERKANTAVTEALDRLSHSELSPELRFIVYRNDIEVFRHGVLPKTSTGDTASTPVLQSPDNPNDAMRGWLASSVVLHERIGSGPLSITAALPLAEAVERSLVHDRRALLDLSMLVLVFAVVGVWVSGQAVKPMIKLARLTASASGEGSTEQINAIQQIHGFESREGKTLREALTHALQSKHDALQRIRSLAEDRASLIEYAGVPIVVLNLDGTIVDWNRSAETLTGVQVVDVLGKKVQDVIADEIDPDKIPLAVGAAASGMVLKDIELHLKSRQGDSHTLLVSVVPLHDETGSINRLLAIAIDISDHLKAEQRLSEMAKMENLGEMATGLSHELNQPLDVVRFVLQNLKRLLKNKEHDPVKVQAKLERIDEQITRAAEIVTQMRLLGKSAISEEKKWFPVDAGVRSAVEMFQEQLAVANIDFVVTLTNPPPNIFGNPERLGAVIVSLLANSRDAVRQRFNDDFGGWITVRSRVRDQHLELLVEDNGGGVPKEILSKIFDPFFTSKAPNRGSGLGLAVSYNTIADMGGSIVADNTGEGLKTTIKLPIDNQA